MSRDSQDDRRRYSSDSSLMKADPENLRVTDKPFYKKKWFFWTVGGVAAVLVIVGVIIWCRLDEAGVEKDFANAKQEGRKMINWDSSNSTSTDALSRTSTYSSGSIDRTATASIGRPTTDPSLARPSLTDTAESSLSATESETLRNTATA